MKTDELASYYEEETYSKGLSREDTIENQVRICAFQYSKGQWMLFEYSLHMLIALLPKEIRDKFKLIPVNIDSNEEIIKHYQQFVDIQEELEVNTTMIFKKKSIKSYQ